jgi:hypothetical protein
VLAGEKRVLEMIAGGNALDSILDALCRVVEEISCGSLCSILILDAKGDRLWHGAGPSLPKSYLETFNGREIVDCCGPCAMAASRGTQIIAADIRADPVWERYREWYGYGLQACWSTPIFLSGKVLGICDPLSSARNPTQGPKLIERFTHLASIAISTPSEEALQQQAYLTEAAIEPLAVSAGTSPTGVDLVGGDFVFLNTAVKTQVEMVLSEFIPRTWPGQQTIDIASRQRTSLDPDIAC